MARQQADSEAKATGSKRVTWADIAIRAALPIAEGLTEANKKGTDIANSRRTATIVALKHYRNANAFIAASASTSFPTAKQ